MIEKRDILDFYENKHLFVKLRIFKALLYIITVCTIIVLYKAKNFVHTSLLVYSIYTNVCVQYTY